METIVVLRQQLKDSHGWLEGTMQGLTDAQVHWKPAGRANPISGCYGHVILGEDWAISVLKGGAPLMAGSHAGKTGFSAMPPQEGNDWHQWALDLKVDVSAARAYAQAVADNADKYIASLKPADLDRVVNGPAGPQPVYWWLSSAIIGHIHEFTGEISCLKGLQGLKGYPA